MTLRSRLTAAFLAVVLGPVLLGAVFVGTTVASVTRDRAVERLDFATTAVRTSIGSLCEQLRAVADAVAVLAAVDKQADVARRAVATGLASAVRTENGSGDGGLTTDGAPPSPWADCAGAGADWVGDNRYEAIAARVEVRDQAGALVAVVYAARLVDTAFVRRLADASGADLTLLAGADGRARADLALSTVDEKATGAVVGAALPLTGPRLTKTEDGRYARRDGPVAGQPLPLVLSVSRPDPRELYLSLLALVVLAALAAVAVAWWLARSTTRPLAELARTADLVASGDLAARVPVRGHDEVGRLGDTFNRMTRETQAYVHALTASRDQLRGHLAILGDTLSSTHDLGRILRVILQTALAATGARAGVVLLADSRGPADSRSIADSGDTVLVGQCAVLVGQCAEGLAERCAEPDGLRVPLGVGLLGGVAETGEARRGLVERDGPELSADEPRCRTYVVVPFWAPDRSRGTRSIPLDQLAAVPAARGVLALYDRLGQDEFDDADLVTLRTFAGRAAVAVDNVRVHEEAQRLSLTDPLTGLWNYRYLCESLRREVERAHRFGRTLSVLALDLDRFKEVNDSYGHGAGDTVLAEFARRTRAEVREVDLAFRRGGEEFVVLLPETDAAGAAVVAQRIGAVVRSVPIAVAPGLAVPVTVSIGIAVYPDDGTGGGQVLQAADDALYAAKAAGRDTHRIAGAVPVHVVDQGRSGSTSSGGASGGLHPPRQSRGG